MFKLFLLLSSFYRFISVQLKHVLNVLWLTDTFELLMNFHFYWTSMKEKNCLASRNFQFQAFRTFSTMNFSVPHAPPSHSVVMMAQPVGPYPQRMTCHYCNTPIVTRVDYQSSTKTHMIALLICIFIGCCGCCLIPYCKSFFRSF